MPTFSVCIPNFNYAQYIGQTIQSVLDQSYDDFEIVIADNASSDNSLEVIRSFDDPRIRIIENNYNVGFAPNLQKVTQHAKGDYFILLSSDDLMKPDALADYHDVFKAQGDKANATVLCSATDVIDQDGTLTRVIYKPRGQFATTSCSVESLDGQTFEGCELMRGRDVLRAALRNCESVAVFCATAYPRALWKKVEGYDTTYQIMPDAAFLHKLLFTDPDYVFLNKRLFQYRVHDANQNAAAKRKKVMRQQVDGYMRTANYPQNILNELGISRNEVVRVFIEKMCMNESLRELERGNWVDALKIFLFALSVYPGETLGLSKSYLVAGMLAGGPIGVAAGRIGRRLYYDPSKR